MRVGPHMDEGGRGGQWAWSRDLHVKLRLIWVMSISPGGSPGGAAQIDFCQINVGKKNPKTIIKKRMLMEIISFLFSPEWRIF